MILTGFIDLRVVNSETYQYYSYPFCPAPPGRDIYKREDLGQVLEGDRLVHTNYRLPFRMDVVYETLCNKTLPESDIRLFRQAVQQDYYYQVQ